MSNSFGDLRHNYVLMFYEGQTILHIIIQSILSFTIYSYHCDSKKLEIIQHVNIWY